MRLRSLRKRYWVPLAALVGVVAVLHGVGRADWVDRYARAALVEASAARGVTIDITRAHVAWPFAVALHDVSVQGRGVAFTAERAVVYPRWVSLLRGHKGVAGVSLVRAVVSVDLARASSARAEATGAGVSVELGELTIDADNLVVRLHRGDTSDSVQLAGASVRLTRADPGVAKVVGTIDLSGGGEIAVEASFDREIHGQIWVSAARPTDLPQGMQRYLPSGLAGTWQGEATLQAPRDLRTGQIGLRLATSDSSINNARVAPDEVGPIAGSVATTVRWNSDRHDVSVDDTVLAVGENAELRARVLGEASLRTHGLFSTQVEVAVPDSERLVAALPNALRPPLEAPALRGPLTGTLSISGPWQRPDDWVVEGKLDLAAMKALARARPCSQLQGGFTYRAVDARGNEREVVVGRGNGDYVPLSELPRHVGDAVMASEDAGFYGHQGFDFNEIKCSAVAVAQAGRAVRGGSTITQQLAKNLFLSREKTLSRKAREALITLALESNLTKSRLLELYVNAIEWGPGIYGVGAAARVYFGKDARALTLREAAYLASIIPSPVSSYSHYARGEITPMRASMLDTILRRMTAQGRVDFDTYLQALQDPLVFRTN